jgi:hypothetical protein
LSGGQSNRSGARRDLQTRLVLVPILSGAICFCWRVMQLFRVAGPQGSKRQIESRLWPADRYREVLVLYLSGLIPFW